MVGRYTTWVRYPPGINKNLELLVFAIISVLASFIISVMLSLPSAHAQLTVPPCGVVTKNMTLTSDCQGPLIVESDHITIDLGRHSIVVPDESPPGLQLVDRVGVTVRNGYIGGSMSTLLIKIHGGHSNTLETLNVEVFNGGIIFDIRQGATFGQKSNSLTISKSAFRVVSDSDFGRVSLDGLRFIDNSISIDLDYQQTASFNGSTMELLRNVFGGRGGSVDLVGSGIRFENNLVSAQPTGLEYSDIPVNVNANGSVVRDNSIIPSGPNAIRATIGIRVSGNDNLIERNSIGKLFYEDNGIPGPPLLSTGVSIESGANNVIRNNRIVSQQIGISLPQTGPTTTNSNLILATEQGIIAESSGTSIQQNLSSSTILDLTDASPTCAGNMWKENLFSTDSEGDGPFLGCIR